MKINTIIHCLNHAQLSGCLDCPDYIDLDGSIASCRATRIKEAKEVVEKYQKIEQIVTGDWDKGYQNSETLRRIKEVLKDGSAL